jgi:hypothetical protein
MEKWFSTARFHKESEETAKKGVDAPQLTKINMDFTDPRLKRLKKVDNPKGFLWIKNICLWISESSG